MSQISDTQLLDVKVFGSRKEMGAAAADRFAMEVQKVLERKPEANVVFAAAPSQNEFLRQLELYPIQWERINAFHMDEYIGLSADSPQGFGNFLRERLFGRFSFASVNYLKGNAEDIDSECERYAALLSQYPVDIVCMGIGENGHLAFNDPPVADFEDAFAVKQVLLDETCRLQQVNDGCFQGINEVPTAALTLTIPSLLKAGYVGCVVPGMSKAEAVYNTVNKELISQYPSTILRIHQNAVLFLDLKSAAKL